MISFVAEHPGPPRRKLYLWRDERVLVPSAHDNGWSFQVTEFAASGEETPGRDAWAETYAEILMYPDLYAPREVVWTDTETGAAVDIYTLDLKP